MSKSRNAGLCFRIVLGGRAKQNPDPSYTFALLRYCSERP
jgi:hypothetical protein